MNPIAELQRVDWNNPGTLSAAARAVISAGILLVFAGLGYYFFIEPKIAQRELENNKEMVLKADFEAKQKQAANLEPLKEQLDVMRSMLDQMLKQLPNKTQLADLLVDVSQEALSAGIQVQLFQPQAELLKEFYAERPILLRMVGSYHQFGDFVSGVATLPRVVILTMHDIALTPADAKSGAPPGSLVLEGLVKTYRYLEEEEIEQAVTPPGAPGAPAAK